MTTIIDPLILKLDKQAIPNILRTSVQDTVLCKYYAVEKSDGTCQIGNEAIRRSTMFCLPMAHHRSPVGQFVILQIMMWRFFTSSSPVFPTRT